MRVYMAVLAVFGSVIHFLDPTLPAIAVQVGSCRENSMVLVAGIAAPGLRPLCKDPREDRLLLSCNLQSASRTAAVQIVE